MNKKCLFTGIIVFIIIIVVVSGIAVLLRDGYLYIGDVWFDTPEEALQYAADDISKTKEVLTVKKIINNYKIDDIAIMMFVSQNDTLVTVTFVTNQEGLYSVYGYTEEVFLDSPTEFVVNGDDNQFILFPYDEYNNSVYGWCYSDVTPTVNGKIPSIQTYEFDCQGKTWSLNFWFINEPNEKTENIVEFKNAEGLTYCVE